MRQVNSQLEEMIPRCQTQSAIVLQLRDGTVKRYSTGLVADAGGNVYLPHLRRGADIVQTTENETDRTKVIVQNVDCQMGLDIVSSARKFERALCTVQRVYKFIHNPSAAPDFRTLFPGMVVGVAADELEAELDIVPDYEGIGNAVADRTETDYCDYLFKGLLCGYAGALETCNHKLKSEHGCAGRANIHRNGSFAFPDQPAVSAAPSGDEDIGGGIFGDPPCFLGHATVWTPRGEIPFWDLEKEMKKSRACYSFDPKTGERYTDEISYLMRHDALGYFDFEFDHARLPVTPEHPLFVGLNRFLPAFEFRTGSTVKAMPERKMVDSVLRRLKWHRGGVPQTVYNIKVKHFETYFANRVMVHNKLGDGHFQIY